MSKTDKIAILLAAYNGEAYIEEQIESILAQTDTQWQLYIHDDGSVDHTEEIIRRYEKQHPEHIHVLKGPPCGGAKNNFLSLLTQVKAPYYMFCDQDDIWKPEKIALTAQRMAALESDVGPNIPLLVFSDLSVIDKEGNLIAKKMSRYQQLDPRRTRSRDLVIQNVITGCTIMVNRTLAERVLQIKDTDAVIMHDWWCALLAACYGKIGYIKEPLVLYRQHKNNTVGAKNLQSLGYLWSRINNHADIKKTLLSTQKQAESFVQLYSLEDPVLREYGGLGKKPKIQRLLFYAKNGIHKCGLKRNIGLLIWG